MSGGQIVAPCMGCEKREPGCHGKCEDYLAFKAAHEAEKAERIRGAGEDVRNYFAVRDQKIKRNIRHKEQK